MIDVRSVTSMFQFRRSKFKVSYLRPIKRLNGGIKDDKV